MTPRPCPSFEDLSAFLDGEVPLAERAALETHVAACAACRTVLAELGATASLLRSLPPESASEDLVRRVARAAASEGPAPPAATRATGWPVLRLAAAILVGVTAVAAIMSGLRLRESGQAPTVALAERDDLPAAPGARGKKEAAGDVSAAPTPPAKVQEPRAQEARGLEAAKPDVEEQPAAAPGVAAGILGGTVGSDESSAEVGAASAPKDGEAWRDGASSRDDAGAPPSRARREDATFAPVPPALDVDAADVATAQVATAEESASLADARQDRLAAAGARAPRVVEEARKSSARTAPSSEADAAARGEAESIVLGPSAAAPCEVTGPGPTWAWARNAREPLPLRLPPWVGGLVVRPPPEAAPVTAVVLVDVFGKVEVETAEGRAADATAVRGALVAMPRAAVTCAGRPVAARLRVRYTPSTTGFAGELLPAP